MPFSTDRSPAAASAPPIRFPSTRSGVAGIAFKARRPMICNRLQARILETQDPLRFERIFFLPPRRTPQPEDAPAAVRSTWTLSSPIFDPQESRQQPITLDQPAERNQHDSVAAFPFDPPVYGPVIGVLNLDALWSYESVGLLASVETHLRDDRVRDVFEAAQPAALRIGKMLAWKGLNP